MFFHCSAGSVRFGAVQSCDLLYRDREDRSCWLVDHDHGVVHEGKDEGGEGMWFI